MTDYAEEQRNEIEALESIYPDEIESKIVSNNVVFRHTQLSLSLVSVSASNKSLSVLHVHV